MQKELWIVPFPKSGTEDQMEAVRRLLMPLAEEMGLIVMVSPYAPPQEAHPMAKAATALEANTTAVLELCGLVAASFEQGQEEAYDAPGGAQTMNSPRRKR